MKSSAAYCLILLSLLFAASNPLRAADATWNLSPISSDWNTAANWTPATVPDGQATFDVSNRTHISISADASVDSIVFNPSASAFTIKTDPAVNQSYLTLILTGLGIINNSGITQNIGSGIDAEGNGSSISFTGNATVSSGVRFTTEGNPTGDFAWGSSIGFSDYSSAGEGTYHNKGASVPVSAGGRT